MPHRDLVADERRVRVAHHMDDATILDVGAVLTDLDIVVPSATRVPVVLTDLDIDADHLCAVVYERRGCHAREARAMGPEHRRKLYVEQAVASVQRPAKWPVS